MPPMSEGFGDRIEVSNLNFHVEIPIQYLFIYLIIKGLHGTRISWQRRFRRCL